MWRPHCCPVCNNPTVKTTLQDYPVSAKIHGEDREVQGLAAFQCENGHFFFLCRTDLVTDEMAPVPATKLGEGPATRNIG